MRKSVLKYLILFVFTLQGLVMSGQSFVNARMNYFFDNDEFAKSSYAKDKTLSGVHLVPEIGLNLPFHAQLVAGVDMLSLSGSAKLVDKAELLAYFRFKDKKNRLLIGNFPKETTLTNYSDFFFSDSSRYFNPNINGVFYERGISSRYIRLWLDWTGMKSEFQRETFFVGSSGYLQKGELFWLYKSYLYHYANADVRTPGMYVTDNGLLNAIMGWKHDFDQSKILLSAGILFGYERERTGNAAAQMPVGLTSSAEFLAKWWGMKTRLYWGQPRDVYYAKQSYDLYWNNPFLRGPYYVRSEWFLKFMDNKYADGRISSGFHFSEGRVYFEQKLSLKIALEVKSKQELFFDDQLWM